MIVLQIELVADKNGMPSYSIKDWLRQLKSGSASLHAPHRECWDGAVLYPRFFQKSLANIVRQIRKTHRVPKTHREALKKIAASAGVIEYKNDRKKGLIFKVKSNKK